MRQANIVDQIVIKGRFVGGGMNTIAAFNVVNDNELTNLTYDEETEAAKELAEFLLEVVPAGVLSQAFDMIEEPISRLVELGDHFDELAFEKLATTVDPGLNAFFVDKHTQWNGGAFSTGAALTFIKRAVEYAEQGHKELASV